MQPLDVGESAVVGPYRLLGRLGAGGMGRVYLGRSTGGRTVAVKIVHPHFALDEEFRARFRREVEAARRVGGAWTASVLDADPDAPVPWVATAYAAGPSLTAAITNDGPLPLDSVRALGAGLAEALTAVHALNLVHRDVKPSNVLLTLDGPLLIDFGIARATDGTASLTSTGVSVGSPGYMSPEQILGRPVTGAADVFSLGAVLAYAATGRSPFPGDSSAALLYKVVHEEPRLDGLEGELREVVEDCLAKDPTTRPAPAEVGRRLAPEGAARLVAGGWLPGPVVERVSRDAVALLNLEAAQAAAQEGELSGPVGFSTPMVAGAEAGAGEFGPPPVMPGPRAAEPQPEPEPSDRVPGKVSVSVAATSVPGVDGRGRKLSCTVALAVAGALAVVTVGSTLLFDLLPGGGADDSGSSKDSSQAAESSASSEDTARTTQSPPQSTVPGPVSGTATVPASYVGTWEGPAVALGGTLPMGTFRVTVQKAAVGEKLGTFRQTDQIGGICDDDLFLKEVTKTRLVVTSIADKSNRSVCTTGSHRVLLTPVGDDLQYETDNPEAGDPVARMSRVG
ncbi:serine/threonine-protein kinase [Streptomyces sp. WI04-05B]|uniref:serine/threonine-protein kinase n=1 Tax=Streptomyces TaxID=1883 RepID=UPI0029A96A4B|nr:MULTISPECIES: serine/threonine-protein kinase [unclassified Streptomyces]MDX2542528.1 serine/threonine-protein kinase [Streptomyces sp. WI04-05B]MDX2582453.1 serine/threonine-protein kinase [Streptomyces sp. WI04-05A]